MTISSGVTLLAEERIKLVLKESILAIDRPCCGLDASTTVGGFLHFYFASGVRRRVGGAGCPTERLGGPVVCVAAAVAVSMAADTIKGGGCAPCCSRRGRVNRGGRSRDGGSQHGPGCGLVGVHHEGRP